MNQIYSAIEQDPLERFQRDAKKITDNQAVSAAAKTPSEVRREKEAPLSLLSAQNRLALRKDYTYQGLLAARALFEKTVPPEEKEERLLAHIRETRFLDAPVLEEFKGQLLDIFRADDAKAFDALLSDAAFRFQSVARDEVIRENITALSSQNPGDLLKSIIDGLKSGNLPAIEIQRQRVLDLLK